jgi:hypothetical protein
MNRHTYDNFDKAFSRMLVGEAVLGVSGILCAAFASAAVPVAATVAAVAMGAAVVTSVASLGFDALFKP